MFACSQLRLAPPAYSTVRLLAMAGCASMATIQYGWFSLRPCPTGFSTRAEDRIRVTSSSRRVRTWRQHLCLRTGIVSERRAVRCSPWRSSLVESPEDRKFLIFSTAFLREAAAVCWKWMLAVAMAVSINCSADTAIALGCDDVARYYTPASGLTGANLKAKLHEIVAGHKQLSYAQVWNALKILDAADTETPDTSPDIVDIYSLKRLPKSLQASSEGWNREHLWPRSYGLMEGRPEFTDVHNLRPADVNVNSSRGNKYFGDCTTLKTTRCLIPANKEAGADTATDVNTWRPPSQVRGDIARAVFYMAVRYGIEQPSGNLNLQLSDSPNVANATMGLLSTLLEWNNLDPPSSSEVLRNARVCSLYQGNRNPFVDHPEYATSIWGAPDVLVRSTTGGNDNELPNAWINEIHYTNQGQDQDEFIEVVVSQKTDVSSLKIYLCDSNGTAYRELQLADAALFHVYNVEGSSALIYAAELPGGSIQNGPGDGIALVMQAQGEEKSKVVQFLSYQGVETVVDVPSIGSVSTDIGVQEGNSTPPGGSIGLYGADRRYQDFQWTEFTRAASLKSVNSGQLIR